MVNAVYGEFVRDTLELPVPDGCSIYDIATSIAVFALPGFTVTEILWVPAVIWLAVIGNDIVSMPIPVAFASGNGLEWTTVDESIRIKIIVIANTLFVYQTRHNFQNGVYNYDLSFLKAVQKFTIILGIASYFHIVPNHDL